MPKYTIFGAGPSGLYTAWRLITSGKLSSLDTIEMVEWSHYSFSKNVSGDRLPAGRICTHHHDRKPGNSYIEMGGMRFLQWNGSHGNLLVSKTIEKFGLPVEDFPGVDDPLFYMREKHFYQKDETEAPYNGVGKKRPSDLVKDVAVKLTGSEDGIPERRDQCNFFANGTLPTETKSVVYKSGDPVSNIGYWNFLYDQLGQEGYSYAADGGGYSANVVNWNAASAAIYSAEFAPGGKYKKISGGYSRLFTTMYDKIIEASLEKNIRFALTSGRRLQSIWQEGGKTRFRTAPADDPNSSDSTPQTTDYAFMAMPTHALKSVAHGTESEDMANKLDFMNNDTVANYLDSVIEQPSVKIGMFFTTPWWKESKYPPRLEHGGVGPTITDLPLRQVYYFGNNATSEDNDTAIYGLQAAYNDMRNTYFWKEMTLDLFEKQTSQGNEDDDILKGPVPVPKSLEKMVLKQLSEIHFGNDDFSHNIPPPLETVIANWGLKPFGAGYHHWSAHYNVCEVMQNIRFPAKVAGGSDSVFIVGSAYSNDQGWVEGAFCTAESILVEKLGIDPLTDIKLYQGIYPLICDDCSL